MANLGYDWTTIASKSQTKSLYDTYYQYYVNYTITYTLQAKLTSQSVSENKSYISTRAQISVSPGSIDTYNLNYSCTGCTSHSGNNSTRETIPTGTVLTGSTTVNHNGDGTGSLSMSGSFSCNYGPYSFSASGSISLPTIARASKPTASKTSMTLDGSDSIMISTNRASSSFTHSLAITVGSNTVTVNSIGDSYTWTPGVAYWMPYMTSKSMKVTISCTTYNGSTQIGSAQTCTFTLNVDTTTYKPVIGTVTHSDTNSTTAALENDGSYIIGKSTISMSIPVSVNNTGYNSTLKSITVTHNGSTQAYNTTSTSYTAAYTATVGAGTVVIKATDNRGIEVTKTVNLTTIAYSAIKINSIETTRVNANGEPSETGNYLHYKIGYSVFWGNFGKAANTIRVDSRCKLPSASAYSTYAKEKDITTSGTGTVATKTVEGICASEYSSSQQFDFYFRLTDKLSNNAVYVRVHEGVPVYAWGQDHFDVYGSFHIHDRDTVSNFVELTVESVNKLINSDTAYVTTKDVTFSGAVGSSVTWTIFKFGSFRIAVCQWRATTNSTVNGEWAGMYYSNDFNTPNYPFTFGNVLYADVKYVAADTAVHAEAWNSGRASSISKTTAGAVYLTRPNDGGPVTIGHPVFAEIVIGTI